MAGSQQSGQQSGFVIYNDEDPQIPVLISVPHAGRDYPDSLFENLRLPPEMLIRLEDRYTDLLARQAIARGTPTIIATKARAWIDLNRDEQDVDAAMIDGLENGTDAVPSAKQRGGLGLIPRRLSGGGDIWKQRISAEDLQQRISGFHQKYHEAVTDQLTKMRDRFGVAILLDLHSMPPVTDIVSGHPPRFVVGDRFGRSASSRYSELILAFLRQSGFGAALNYPYSGDYILKRHARPAANIHAIQLEVDRSLYLDELLREPIEEAAGIANIIADLIPILSDMAAGGQALQAAE